MLPIVWFMPIFGGPTLPTYIRLSLSFALSGLCYPLLAGKMIGVSSYLFFLIFLRELAVGATMGFLLSLPFRATEMTGRLIDILRGANMAEVIAPLSDTRSSPMGGLFLLLSVLIFFNIGGVHYVYFGLSRSYEAIPLLDLRPMPVLGSQFFHLIVTASAKLLESCVVMAAPVLVSLLMTDLVLGFIGASSPSIPLHFLGMPIKAFLGIGIVLLSFSFLEIAFSNNFYSFARMFDSFFSSVHQ
jgi:type III secretory pathway component EscT